MKNQLPEMLSTIGLLLLVLLKLGISSASHATIPSSTAAAIPTKSVHPHHNDTNTKSFIHLPGKHRSVKDAISANSEAVARARQGSSNKKKSKRSDMRGGAVKAPQPKPEKRDPLIKADYIADTKLPTAIGNLRMRAYKVRGHNDAYDNTNAMEPIILYSADKPPFGEDGKLLEEVPVRIHDQCLTSEVFGSRRCDCREQLQLSLEYVHKNGGAVIYLQQEGRGIGLANKLAAYELQDYGLDTVDANRHLGFPDDARQYGVLPDIFRHMGIASIKLMTNNPRKVNRLTSLGIKIVDTIPILVHPNEDNRRYLEAKKERMSHTNFGHILGDEERPANSIVQQKQQQQRNGMMHSQRLSSQD